MAKEVNTSETDNEDIFALGLDEQTTKRFVRLREKAKEFVEGASENPEGLERYGKVMGFLNRELDDLRKSITN